MLFYTGIGSRQSPPEEMAMMTALGEALAQAGYVLRSGGADGADTAFETGAVNASGPMEIYLPWKEFNGNASQLFGVTPEAVALAETLHPAWERLGQGPRKMHSRNTFQVLGRNLNLPSEFVVCWTPDGCELEAKRTRTTGGTATAIVLALRRGIPVFNLRNQSSRIRLNGMLRTLGIAFQVDVGKIAPTQGALF